MIISMKAQNICFQMPNLDKYFLGVEICRAHQVIKKLKMDHLWPAVSHSMLQQLQNVIKVTEILLW